MNILVIEDNPSHQKLADDVLRAAGYRVRSVEAAVEALAEIRDDKPEIILLDLQLPGMNGLALARQLKEDPETADIPIVAVTSYPERFSRRDALGAGCAAYITKPINTRTLPVQLEELVK